MTDLCETELRVLPKIASWEAELAGETSDDNKHLVLMYQVARAYLQLHDQTDKDEYLDVAVENAQKLVDIMPETQKSLDYRMALIAVLSKRYQSRNLPADFEAAILNVHIIMETVAEGASHHVMCLTEMNYLFRSRFQHTGNDEDLFSAITHARDVVSVTLRDTPKWAVNVDILAQSLYLCTELLNPELSLLDEAIDCFREALRAYTPGYEPLIQQSTFNLGCSLATRYQWTSASIDLEDAIICFRDSSRVAEEQQDDDAEMRSSSRLAQMLGDRFMLTGDVQYLKEARAIHEQQMTNRLDSTNSDSDPMTLICYSSLLLFYFEAEAQHVDLNAAVDISQRAVRIAKDMQIKGVISRALTQYARCLSEKSDVTVDVHIFDEAVEIAYEAISYARGAIDVINAHIVYGQIQLQSFKRARRLVDLELAIKSFKLAKDAALPAHIQPEHLDDDISHALLCRYDISHRLADLENAILSNDTGLALCTSSPDRRAIYLARKALLLNSRFNRSKDDSDLDNAIEAALESVELGQHLVKHVQSHMMTYANVLLARFQRDPKKHHVDLDRAIEIGQASAVHESVKASEVLQEIAMQNLAAMYLKRYDYKRNESDLQACILACRMAANLSTSNEAQHSYIAFMLGSALERSTDVDSQEEALHAFIKAWEFPQGDLNHRLQSAHAAIYHLGKVGQWQRASEISRAAVRLLPQLVTRYISRSDQQYIATQFFGLAALSCALSLQSGDDIRLALETL
jgi:hypothetical protein